MTHINDRWQWPVVAPRKVRAGEVAIARISPRQIAARRGRAAYDPFARTWQQQVDEAAQVDSADSAISEEHRAASFKALALSYYVDRQPAHLRLARRALKAINHGEWGAWCAAADTMIDYLVGADLLRAAGALNRKTADTFREQLAPKVTEAFAVAPELPQNNWRIEADSALVMAGLYWWHDAGDLPIREWLAAGLDGLSRMLFGLLSPNGAYDEGLNYSRRSAIPFVRAMHLYRRLTGVDVLNQRTMVNWARWQLELKAPDGRTMPFDDTNYGTNGWPHALLVHRDCKDAGVQRWAHERAPMGRSEYSVEAMLLFDDRIKTAVPRWPKSRVLANSGTAVCRSSWREHATMGVLLARPLQPYGADAVNTAHRHDDPLNVLIASHGELLIGDAGYGPHGYNAPRRYDWYLAPRAHNLILVDGEGPPRRTGYGNANSGNVSQSHGRVIVLGGSRDLFGARAEASYRDVDFSRAMFFIRNRYFVLVDDIRSPRTHAYTYLMHGRSEDTEFTSHGMLWRHNAAQVVVDILEPSGIALRRRVGEHDNDLPHHYLDALAAGRDVRLVSVIVPDKRGAALPEVRLIDHKPLTLYVHVPGGRTADVLTWPAESTGTDALPTISRDKGI